TVLIASSDAARHFRQQYGPDRDADDADRQLVETVGVPKGRDRAGGQEAGDDRVGKERKLHAARADGGRAERDEETLHIVVPGNAARARQLAQPPDRAGEQRHFEDAGNQNAPGGGVGGVWKKSREREGRHHRKVEQDGRGGRRREAVERVEHAAVERNERHREEIRKGDARERDREREAAGITLEAGGKNADHRRRERDRGGKKHDL